MSVQQTNGGGDAWSKILALVPQDRLNAPASPAIASTSEPPPTSDVFQTAPAIEEIPQAPVNHLYPETAAYMEASRRDVANYVAQSHRETHANRSMAVYTTIAQRGAISGINGSPWAPNTMGYNTYGAAPGTMPYMPGGVMPPGVMPPGVMPPGVMPPGYPYTGAATGYPYTGAPTGFPYTGAPGLIPGQVPGYPYTPSYLPNQNFGVVQPPQGWNIR